jgi:hypothetical protein
LAGAILFDEKIRQRAALFWFGMWDGGLFYSRAVKSKEQYLTFWHFWGTVWWKRLRFVPIQTVIRTSRRLDSFLSEAAQNFKVFSIIQNLN